MPGQGRGLRGSAGWKHVGGGQCWGVAAEGSQAAAVRMNLQRRRAFSCTHRTLLLRLGAGLLREPSVLRAPGTGSALGPGTSCIR